MTNQSITMWLRQFDGVKVASRISVTVSDAHACARVEFAGAWWELTTRLTAVEAHPGKQAGVFCAKVIGGKASQVNAAIEWHDNAWDEANFVMIPGAAYNGNRFRSRRMAYPPLPNQPEEMLLQPDVVIGDVPRLNIESGQPSGLHITTGDASTPCMSVYSPKREEVFLLLTEQGNRFGNFGMAINESDARDSASFILESPVVRPTVYRDIGRTGCPSPDQPVDLEVGDCIQIPFRVCKFKANTVQDLYTRFAAVRKDLAGSVELRHTLPFSASWEILENKYNQDNWNAPHGYYAVGTRNCWENGNHNRWQDWQVGWTGGGMSTLPLLSCGTAISRARALKTLEFMFSKGQASSGLFYAGYHDGELFHDSYDEAVEQSWVMVRKNADALYFLIKHFIQLRKDPTVEIPSHWLDGTRRLADRLVAIYQEYGQFGQFLDVETGAIIVGGSASGALAPGALALAAEYFEEARYLEVAIDSAQDYYRIHALSGVTTGGPGEILQAPDSESAFAMLETLVLLYEVTEESAWLPMAEAMADQCSTWCASYDYRFPKDSHLGSLDTCAAGSVWANVQNKHSAPGICTFSGDSLFKLYRATGELRFLDLITQTAHNLPQYLSREDRQVGDPSHMHPGWMCERVNFSDWEGAEGIGAELFGSCWAEVSLALTTIEIPGLYIQTDTELVHGIDNIDVEVTGRDGDSLQITLSNPTAFDAHVRVLSETSEQARRSPLGQLSVLELPVVIVPAMGRVEIVARSGSIFAQPSDVDCALPLSN